MGLAAAMLLGSAFTQVAKASDSDPSVLMPQLENRWIEYRVVFELSGKLLWKSSQSEGSTPVEVRSDQVYRERVVRLDKPNSQPNSERQGSEAHLFHAARWYDSATGQYVVSGKESRTRLADQRRLVILDRLAGPLRAYSPWEPLPRAERDLVDLPFPTFAVERLFVDRPLRPGQTWQVDSAGLADCLGLTEVTGGQVQGQWVRNEGPLAMVQWEGQIQGRVEQARTTLQIQGRGQVSCQERLVRWLAVSIAEKRSISEAQPGLDITARLRIVARPFTERDERSEHLEAVPEPIFEQAVVLVRTDNPRGHWSILHEPDWLLIVERFDISILRLFHEGQLLAQMIVSVLPDAPPERQLAPSGFQQEILSALKPYSGQILETTQGVNRNGVRVLRATAVGTVGERALQWFFYHLSDDAGHCASLVFTVETDKLELFGERDRVVVETFAFGPAGDKPPVSDRPPGPSEDLPSRPQRSADISAGKQSPSTTK